MRKSVCSVLAVSGLALAPVAAALHPHDPAPHEPASCYAPPPAAKDTLIFLGGYEGSATSSVTVVGQDGETNAARLIIEEGDSPLYIMAASFEPMVWQIEGAADRVAQFVTGPARISEFAGVGVTGLEAGKITFLASDCLRYFYKLKSKSGLTARKTWSGIAGRAPELMHGRYTISSISLPSGETVSREESFEVRDIETRYTAFDFKADGVAKIDPEAVIAPKPVELYDILPGRAGIEQLLGTGHLVKEEKGLRIVKPIKRFPARLTGAQSVKFILPADMPMPAGSPGHSFVGREGEPCRSLICE